MGIQEPHASGAELGPRRQVLNVSNISTTRIIHKMQAGKNMHMVGSPCIWSHHGVANNLFVKHRNKDVCIVNYDSSLCYIYLYHTASVNDVKKNSGQHVMITKKESTYD